MNRSILIGATALILSTAALADQGSYGGTTVTNVTGTIKQVNYGDDGSVQGFLVGTNVLLSFGPGVCGGVSSLGAAGNAVKYSGSAFTTTSGFQYVAVSSFTNATTGVTYTAPSNTPAAYGPTTGTITQLNYTGGGVLNGFLFNPAGSTTEIFVSTGQRPSSTLTTLATVGATVSVTGYTHGSACASSGTLQSIGATSLTIGSTTISVGAGGHMGYR